MDWQTSSESGRLYVGLELDILGDRMTQYGQNLVLVLIATTLVQFKLGAVSHGRFGDVVDERSHVLKETFTVPMLLFKALCHDSLK